MNQIIKKNKLEQIEQIKKEILIGLNEDNNAVVLNIDTIGLNNRPTFSISASCYDMTEVFDDEKGEETARDYLSDGELWRDAVANEQTESSMEDYNEDVLNIDGWQHIIGDLEYIGNNDESELYVRWSCGGQSRNQINEFKKLVVTKKELEKIRNAWDNYHLFDSLGKKELTNEDIKEINRVVNIFKKYPKYDGEQLKQFIGDNEDE